jgi:putative endonuclease
VSSSGPANPVDRVAYVYLLRCSDESLYCGWTFDLERRLDAHRAGRGARYTRSRLPLEVAAVYELPDAASARREEARIKALPRVEKLALIRAAAQREQPRAPLSSTPPPIARNRKV